MVVFLVLEFLFLGIIARKFFTSQVGEMLGEIRLAPAILFYLLYVAGVLIFVSGGLEARWQSTLFYGALFGIVCYATFDLTSLALLKHWTWAVAVVDVSWGAFATSIAATTGLLITNQIVPRM
jgi:uncharacterized membrane protein